MVSNDDADTHAKNNSQAETRPTRKLAREKSLLFRLAEAQHAPKRSESVGRSVAHDPHDVFVWYLDSIDSHLIKRCVGPSRSP